MAAREEFEKVLKRYVVTVVGVFLALQPGSHSWAQEQPAPVRVAIFQGEGAGQSCRQLIEALESSANGSTVISRITADLIRDGELEDVDVLVHPGGSGSRQGRALGEQGRDAVRQFVRAGGGYLGVCAGAYLATNDYDWSLDLIDARVVDRKHWARGKGMVTIRMSESGSGFFQLDEREIQLFYAQGPLLDRREHDDPDVPDFECLAEFATEIAKNGAPSGVMTGTSAVVCGEFGNGRVICFSPHPELTDGQQHLIRLSVKWLGDKSSPGKPE